MNDTTNRVIAIMVVIILATGAYYVGRVNGVATPKGDSAIELSPDGVTKVDTGAPEVSGSTGEVPAGPTVTAGGESVTVVDQPAGSVVKVASVTLPQVGWVAVRDNNGRVLGARRFEAGTSSNVEVVLLRDTVAGEKYQVLLYNDDGDGEYDLHKDSLVMNADASVAGTTFNAQ